MNRSLHFFVCLFSCIGLCFSAQALSLAGIEVQSHKGEPLHAEVSVDSATAQEWGQLVVKIAPAERFTQLGLVYTPALAQLQVELLETQDGSKRIRIAGPQNFSENFVDLLIEAQTASGKWVKAFTLMLKPALVKTQAPLQLATAAAMPNKTDSPTATEHVVQRGESASQIIQKWLTQDMSTQQMLVALLKNQPDAFIEGNVNLLRAGAVLKAPTATAVKAIDPDEARQFLVTQQKEFLAFSQAASLNTHQVKGQDPSRQISGKVGQEDNALKVAEATIDQLKLTQAKVEKQNAETRLAAQRALQDAQKQLDTLQSNVNQLVQLTAPLTVTQATSPAKDKSSAIGSGWLNVSQLLASPQRNSFLWAALTLLGVLAVWAGLKIQSRSTAHSLSTLVKPNASHETANPMDHHPHLGLPADITALNLDLNPQHTAPHNGLHSPAPTETRQ